MIFTMELIPTIEGKGRRSREGGTWLVRCLWVNCGDGFCRACGIADAASRRIRDGDPQGRAARHRRDRCRESRRRFTSTSATTSCRIPRDQVLRRAKGDEADGRRRGRSPGRSSEDASGFYTTGVLKPSPVKELVSKFGEAVISIETPSGKGSGFLINKDGYAITNAHVIQGETPDLGDPVRERPGRFQPAADRGRRDRRARTRSSIWPCSSFLCRPT